MAGNGQGRDLSKGLGSSYRDTGLGRWSHENRKTRMLCLSSNEYKRLLTAARAKRKARNKAGIAAHSRR